MRSGITTEISIPVARVQAQHISPALFALDDAGVIGVRAVGGDGRVRFHAVDIVREDAAGVWVSGLPAVTTLITVGQELVMPGEYVEVDFEPTSEMPAAVPAPMSSDSEPDSSPRPGESARQRMNAVIDAAINRYKTTLMVMVMVVVAGLLARNAIPVANEPDIQVPFYRRNRHTRGNHPGGCRAAAGHAAGSRSCATSRASTS